LDARHATDRILAQKPWGRVIAKDASLGEKQRLYSHKRHESQNETWYGIKEEEDEGKARLSIKT